VFLLSEDDTRVVYPVTVHIPVVAVKRRHAAETERNTDSCTSREHQHTVLHYPPQYCGDITSAIVRQTRDRQGSNKAAQNQRKAGKLKAGKLTAVRGNVGPIRS
jgi:hypothetical protein